MKNDCIYDKPKRQCHGITTDQAQKIGKHANSHKICIVPQLLMLSNTGIMTSSTTRLQVTGQT